jgi:hypothetical protein
MNRCSMTAITSIQSDTSLLLRVIFFTSTLAWNAFSDHMSNLICLALTVCMLCCWTDSQNVCSYVLCH